MTGSLAVSPLSPGCGLQAICAPVQGLGSIAGHALGSAASSVTTGAALAIFHAFESSLAVDAKGATGHMLTAVFHEADIPSLSGPWFLGQLAAMARVTALVVFPLLMAASIGAVMRQDLGRLVRTWLIWLPLAGISTLLLIPIVTVAVDVCDQMTSVVTGGIGTQIQQSALHLVPAAIDVGGGLLATVIGALVLLGALAIWLEMVVRSSAILITVFFLPLLLVCLVWPATAHVVRRVVEVLVALILSKFVVAAVLCLGVAAMAPGNGAGNHPDLLVGVAILLLAAFSPMVLLRLVPVVEAAAIGHLEGRARQPFRAATDAAGRAHRQLPMMAKMLGVDGPRSGASSEVFGAAADQGEGPGGGAPSGVPGAGLGGGPGGAGSATGTAGLFPSEVPRMAGFPVGDAAGDAAAGGGPDHAGGADIAGVASGEEGPGAAAAVGAGADHARSWAEVPAAEERQ